MSLIRQNKGMSLALTNSNANAGDVKEIKAVVKVTQPATRPVEAVVTPPTPPPAPTPVAVTPSTSTDSSVEAELRRQLAELQAENSSLKMSVEMARKLAKNSMSLKISEKGGLSLYGLGRFPVTLYVEQWEKLLSFTDVIKEFISTNRSFLKSKEQK